MGTKRTPSEQAKFNRCVEIMARMILIHEANKAKDRQPPERQQ